jgi:hypothetical protein
MGKSKDTKIYFTALAFGLKGFILIPCYHHHLGLFFPPEVPTKWIKKRQWKFLV